jgi:DNA repair protein RadA/Sms
MSKSVFFCSNCGNEFPKWVGQCTYCKEWNTIKEQKINENYQNLSKELSPVQTVKKEFKSLERFKTFSEELNLVLGGGIVKDSIILLTGDPGIGKSSLALITALNLAKQKKVLYISGEESIDQLSEKIHRFKQIDSKLLLLNEYLLENIFKAILQEKPELVIIDSIQTIISDNLNFKAGSVSQIKIIAEKCMQFFKNEGIALILIGHVTKDGTLSGPQTLAHFVDTVLYLEGEATENLRLLRSQKNRFGSTDCLGVFKMTETGLNDLSNPSLEFLNKEKKENQESSVLTSIIDGKRSFFLEVQALSVYTKFGYPKKIVNGYDLNRLYIMLAVIQKYTNLKTDNRDFFINIAGGLKSKDTSLDLAVVVSILSSIKKKSVSSDYLFLGEVGLNGEIRIVKNLEKRILEAKKLGFKKIVCPVFKEKNNNKDLIQIKNIKEISNLFFS